MKNQLKIDKLDSSLKIKVGIAGARGYSGSELVKLILGHPFAELKYFFHSKNGAFQLEELGIYPKEYVSYTPKAWNFERIDEVIKEIDVLFLATPHEVSLDIIPKIFQTGVRIIDLSGIFRLKYTIPKMIQDQYLKHYQIKHDHPELFEQFTYGLSPFYISELFPQLVKPSDDIKNISNPGCYATSVMLALIPLLSESLVETQNIVIDAKSGTSGGGKKAVEGLLFSEVFNECLPYKVGMHQHVPEMELYLKTYTKKDVKFVFTPHLMPFHRGIVSSIYLKWNSDLVKLSSEEKKEAIIKTYKKYFDNYNLVRWAWIKENKNILNLKYVVNTSLTQIGFDFDETNIYVFSMIDNLLKGAASQAVENMNTIFKLNPEVGLTPKSKFERVL